MKKEQITDWFLFKDGESFENGHFYTLFMEADYSEIEQIYSCLPKSNELVLKMKNYLLREETSIKSNNTPELLDVLIKLDFEEKKYFFRKHNEFSELLNNWKFVYLDDFNEVDGMYGELNQDVIDYFSDYTIDEDNKLIYVIYDALYGFTTNFDMQLYLFAPLLSLNYTGEYMFQFKKLGGIYAINDDDNIVYYSYKKPTPTVV